MNETQNTQIVRDAYAAFLQGDIQGILAKLDDDVLWKAVTGAAPHVPTAGERRGKEAVGEFFRLVGETTHFSEFEPRNFVAQGEKVVSLGHYTARTSAGGSFASDFVMVFTLRDGKVVEFQEFMDSAALNASFAPAETTV